MNVRTNYPFDAAVVRRFKYENAVFVVFLTGKLFFRHTNPAQASETIAFSPFHATFPTVIVDTDRILTHPTKVKLTHPL
ncbi:hypothetical protein EWM60_18925 [Candidatus Erwinia dacicola]|nr:hypothetical protein [Candidatus Erwinia dacicola]